MTAREFIKIFNSIIKKLYSINRNYGASIFKKIFSQFNSKQIRKKNTFNNQISINLKKEEYLKKFFYVS